MGVIQLQPRSVGEDLKSFSKTFTSFDKCMEKNTCKIPFIIACVLGGIIVISTLWCLFRCILCGYACCTCCCGGCGGRQSKGGSTTYILPPAPLTDGPPQHHYDEPKFAYYDSASDDALPHMPSARGVDVKQEVEESHEMGEVRRLPSQPKTRPGELNLGMLSPEKRPGSAASSYYSNQTGVFGTYNDGNQPYTQTRTLLAPQAASAGGKRNTLQRAYGQDAGLNPYQYQGPRQQGYHVPGQNNPTNQRRPEEWTVL